MAQSKPFVTQKDIDELARNDVNYEEDIKVFLTEMRKYCNEFTSPKDYIENEWESLEQFNKEELCNYPSYGGHCILDDMFTGNDCPLELLSNKTIGILGYFYGIHLRYFNDGSEPLDEGNG